MSGEERLPGSVQAKLTSVNERILAQAYDIYADPNKGLVRMGAALGLEVRAPRKKVTILLLGNHSAGKSTFINWYVEEHVQRTGVAIETQGFSVVTSGRRRESLKGRATLHLFPNFRSLSAIPGVLDYLGTEVCPSKRKKFPLLTFIDSPGLVDGDLLYPFNVNDALVWLGLNADLVLVFFDPIGQALCRRTLEIVNRINAKAPERIRFFLTKADEAGTEADRQRVLMQIVQELCKYPGLNRAGFDMPVVYVPDETICRNTRSLNQMDRLTGEIEGCIAGCVQKILEDLEKDCDLLAAAVDAKIKEDEAARRSWWTRRCHGFIYGFLWFFVLITICLAFLLRYERLGLLCRSTLGPGATDVLMAAKGALNGLWELVPADWGVYAFAAFILFMILLAYLTKRSFRVIAMLSRSDKAAFLAYRDFVQTSIKESKHKLYKEYLEQSIVDQEQ